MHGAAHPWLTEKLPSLVEIYQAIQRDMLILKHNNENCVFDVY